MYIIMSTKLPNIKNIYPYPKTKQEMQNAKANYNRLITSMKLLHIVPNIYIQNHTPKPKRSRPSKNRASTKKKARSVGTWRGTTNNIGESFLKHDGRPFTPIDQRALNLKKSLRNLNRTKKVTSRVKTGSVNVKERKKVFEGKKNEKPSVKGRARGRRLSLNQLKPFEGAAPKPTQTPHSSRNGRVVLTSR